MGVAPCNAKESLCLFICRIFKKLAGLWWKGFIPTWRTWGTWSFQEKRLSLQVIGEKDFFEEVSDRNMMLSGRFFFTSVFVLCHSETLRDWSLNTFYMYLVPPLLYRNLNYSVSMFSYFSIWFLITKNFELIWYFDFCFSFFSALMTRSVVSIFDWRCCLELG